MMVIKVYRYPIPRPKRPPVSRGARPPLKEQELLTKSVQGEPASDLEERYARALAKNKRVMWYTFRVPLMAPAGFPGSIDLDFMVFTGSYYPKQIDGQFAHKSAAQRARDAENDATLDDYLYRNMGAHPVERIPFYKLESQESADRLIMESF